MTLLCSLFILFILLPFLYKTIFYTDDDEQPKETKEDYEAQITEENLFFGEILKVRQAFSLWFSAHILDFLIVIILIAILVIVA